MPITEFRQSLIKYTNYKLISAMSFKNVHTSVYAWKDKCKVTVRPRVSQAVLNAVESKLGLMVTFQS